MRKEILKLSAGWVLCAALCAACGENKTIVDKRRGFTMNEPKYYEEPITDPKRPSALTYESYYSTWEFRASIDVLVTDNKQCFDIKDWVKALIYTHGERKEFRLLEQTEGKFVDGRSTVKLVYTDREEMIAYHFECYLLIVGSRRYMITVMTQARDHGKFAKEFDELLASFKIIEAK